MAVGSALLLVLLVWFVPVLLLCGEEARGIG